MALPSSRNTTYGADSPVKSADLNALQDAVVGRKHGSISRFVAALLSHTTGWTLNEGPPSYVIPGAAVDAHYQRLPLIVGDRLQSIKVRHWSGGAGSKTFGIYKVSAAGVWSLLDAAWETTFDPADGSIQHQNLDGPDYTLLADESLWTYFVTSHASDRIYGFIPTWDHP